MSKQTCTSYLPPTLVQVVNRLNGCSPQAQNDEQQNVKESCKNMNT